MVDYDKFYRDEGDEMKMNIQPPSSAELLYTKFFTVFYIILIICSFPLSIGLCIQVVQVRIRWKRQLYVRYCDEGHIKVKFLDFI